MKSEIEQQSKLQTSFPAQNSIDRTIEIIDKSDISKNRLLVCLCFAVPNRHCGRLFIVTVFGQSVHEIF